VLVDVYKREFPWGDSPTSLANAIALLELEIALSGRQGLIHMSPAAAVAGSASHILADLNIGVLRTINGTVVVPGYGYAAGATPAASDGFPGGHTDPATITQEWIYASGPVDVRRSDIFTLPETVAEALDRGLGATQDVPNAITYRAERYELVDWDTTVQAAVLIDRCQDECGDPPS
jgi:hypothetical protein